MHIVPGTVRFLDFSVLLYLIYVNLLTLLIVRADRERHRAMQYRIPAFLLFVLAFLGGALAAKLAQLRDMDHLHRRSFAATLNLLIVAQFIVALGLSGEYRPLIDTGKTAGSVIAHAVLGPSLPDPSLADPALRAPAKMRGHL